jgi:hypothetical protein
VVFMSQQVNELPGRDHPMRASIGVVAFICSCTGCTTLALERHALAQAASTSDVRYYEVMDNLAMIAGNPAALPAYSSIFAGLAQITDTGQLTSTTNWQHVIGMGANGFASEAANPQLTRQVLQNWSLDPVAAPEKLEAIRCCCRWAIWGPDHACDDCPGILASPEQAPWPGRHFGVADRLARLPEGWLHVGRNWEIPRSACFKGRCGDTSVWVMPEGMEGLADFTLILQDIARTDINSPTLFYIRPLPSAFTFPTLPAVSPDGLQADVVAGIWVDPRWNLVPQVPYYRARVEYVGSDPNLRATINAAGVH